MQIVRWITDAERLHGRSSYTISARKIVMIRSSLWLFLNAQSHKRKKNYESEHFDFLTKSGNRRAFFEFIRLWKKVPVSENSPSCVLTPQEAIETVETIAKGLEQHICSVLPLRSAFVVSVDQIPHVPTITLPELSPIALRLPTAAPGPDRVTSKMLRILFEDSPNSLLWLVNFAIKHAWIPPEWKIAKVVPLPKNNGSGYSLDNIRPISLTSNVVKLI